MIQWPKSNDVLGTTNRGNPAESGLCTLCRSDCAGKCETWMSCLKGRHMLYPRDFGSVTAGSANTSSTYRATDSTDANLASGGRVMESPKKSMVRELCWAAWSNNVRTKPSAA